MDAATQTAKANEGATTMNEGAVAEEDSTKEVTGSHQMSTDTAVSTNDVAETGRTNQVSSVGGDSKPTDRSSSVASSSAASSSTGAEAAGGDTSGGEAGSS
jgi:hypothetical protein